MNNNRINDRIDHGSRTGTEEARKRTWEQPRLKFVEPRLTEHGQLEHLTGAFFGTFSP